MKTPTEFDWIVIELGFRKSNEVNAHTNPIRHKTFNMIQTTFGSNQIMNSNYFFPNSNNPKPNQIDPNRNLPTSRRRHLHRRILKRKKKGHRPVINTLRLIERGNKI